MKIDIYEVLQTLGITFEKHEHPPVYTAEEAKVHYQNINAAHNKNLFLRNDKGDKHYLVTIESSKRADLKNLAELLAEKKLSFASPERLMKYLGVTPGSVSPFALINDKDNQVFVVVDNDLLNQDSQAFHPCINTQTLVISTSDFKRFLESTGNSISYLTF